MISTLHTPLLLVYFFKDVAYLFLERWKGREKKRERNINVWLPLEYPPTGDLACHPGMCPDRESNWRPFGSQAGTQSTEPHQPGQVQDFKSSLPPPNSRTRWAGRAQRGRAILSCLYALLPHSWKAGLSTWNEGKSWLDPGSWHISVALGKSLAFSEPPSLLLANEHRNCINFSHWLCFMLASESS